MRPFRGRLSNLFLRLCIEVTREAFCFPVPFLTCDWWWQQTVGRFLSSKLVLAARATSQEPWEQGALWKGWKWIKSSQYKQSHQELPVTICSLVCSWDNTDLVCLLRSHFHDQIYHWRKWIHILTIGNVNTPMVNRKISSKIVVIHGIKVTTG